MEFRPQNVQKNTVETDPSLIYKFGSLLGMLRNKSRKNKREMTRLLDIADKTLTNWEEGFSFPTEDQLMRLVEVYSITPEQEVIFRKLFETSFQIYKDSAKFKNQKLYSKDKKGTTDNNYPASQLGRNNTHKAR